MLLKQFFVSLLLFFILPFSLYAVDSSNDSKLIAIVKVQKAKVRSEAVPNDKFIVKYYDLGTVLYLDYCDKYDWCKLKNKNLYISKATIGVMRFKKQKHEEVLIAQAGTTKQSDQIKKKPICIKLKHIDLDENDILDKTTQDDLFSTYIGKCISITLLKKILNTASQYYIDHGYITTKPYLKEQNIKDGQLDIVVLRGKVKKIINNDTNRSDGRIKTAFIFQEGNTLNLRDLETSLEMMNRVPSSHSKFEIVPGDKEGQSNINIKTEKNSPYHLTLGIIGEKQGYDNNPYLNADFSIDNPLNINDILTLRYNGSRIQKYYQSTSGSEVDYSFPIGSYLLSYTWFEFQYSQNVIGLNDSYVTNGDTKGSNLSLSKVLYRNQTNKIETAFSLQYKNNKNYFSNELIDVSSYKTTLAQIDLIHTYIQNWGQLRTMYSYYRGTNWFGARDDGSINGSSSNEKLQFTKYSLDSSLVYYFPIKTYQINSNVHIQYTNDFLYDNNKLRVGSYYTVRGYSSSYYGNNAYYIRNDFIKTFYPNISFNYMQTISPFLGLDYGEIAVKGLADTGDAFTPVLAERVNRPTTAYIPQNQEIVIKLTQPLYL